MLRSAAGPTTATCCCTWNWACSAKCGWTHEARSPFRSRPRLFARVRLAGCVRAARRPRHVADAGHGGHARHERGGTRADDATGPAALPLPCRRRRPPNSRGPSPISAAWTCATLRTTTRSSPRSRSTGSKPSATTARTHWIGNCTAGPGIAATVSNGAAAANASPATPSRDGELELLWSHATGPWVEPHAGRAPRFGVDGGSRLAGAGRRGHRAVQGRRRRERVRRRKRPGRASRPVTTCCSASAWSCSRGWRPAAMPGTTRRAIVRGRVTTALRIQPPVRALRGYDWSTGDGGIGRRHPRLVLNRKNAPARAFRFWRPHWIRTPVATVKGIPEPLDDGDRTGIPALRLVEPAGIEPATSCMPCRRSPS